MGAQKIVLVVSVTEDLLMLLGACLAVQYLRQVSRQQNSPAFALGHGSPTSWHSSTGLEGSTAVHCTMLGCQI